MRYAPLILGFLPVLARGPNVVLSNDDGWAETNIRVFHHALASAGDSVVLSAPAENESETDAPAAPLTSPCEFNSCPSGSPAEGNNASMPRFNYVNSDPGDAMRHGIQALSPKLFGGKANIVVAGFNVGANLGSTVLMSICQTFPIYIEAHNTSVIYRSTHNYVLGRIFAIKFCRMDAYNRQFQVSGTVGAATEASKKGIPGTAFSGTTGSQIAWTAALRTYMTVYAHLSTNVTQTLVASGKPREVLGAHIWGERTVRLDGSARFGT